MQVQYFPWQTVFWNIWPWRPNLISWNIASQIGVFSFAFQCKGVVQYKLWCGRANWYQVAWQQHLNQGQIRAIHNKTPGSSPTSATGIFFTYIWSLLSSAQKSEQVYSEDVFAWSLHHILWKQCKAVSPGTCMGFCNCLLQALVSYHCGKPLRGNTSNTKTKVITLHAICKMLLNSMNFL